MQIQGERKEDHLELQRKESSDTKKDLSMEIFEKMQKSFMEKLPEEDREAYQKFGKKLYDNFDLDKGEAKDFSNICMEEALSYVVETLKSGLHPKYLDEDDRALLEAGYGPEWYESWGYTKQDLA